MHVLMLYMELIKETDGLKKSSPLASIFHSLPSSMDIYILFKVIYQNNNTLSNVDFLQVFIALYLLQIRHGFLIK